VVGYEAIRDKLLSLAKTSEDGLSKTILSVVPEASGGADEHVGLFVGELVQGLAGRTLSPEHAAWLAGDLEEALNPGKGSVRQTQGAIRDFVHGLKVAGMDHGQAEKVGDDLRKLVPVAHSAWEPDAPAHKHRYALSEAPKYDKCVLIEDFEAGGDIFSTWYTLSRVGFSW
jgi:hypothetical protein